MRKITYTNLVKHIELDKNIFYNLIIKCPNEYYCFVMKLINQINLGDSGDFTYSINNLEKPLKNNSIIIDNLFDLNLNNRKIINLLYQEVKRQLIYTDYLEMYNDFETIYNKLLFFIKNNISINVNYNDEIDLLSIFKFANMSLEFNEETIIEKLIHYIKIIVELTHIDIIWLVNLKSFMSEIELNDFIKEMDLLKVNIINIESYERSDKILNQMNILIDEDLCEFYPK